MPLYEYRKNAENHVSLQAGLTEQFVLGTQAVADRIIARIKEHRTGRPVLIACDGWYGVDFHKVRENLNAAANRADLYVEFVEARELFQPVEQIDAYRKPYETDDPAFGWVNTEGVLQDVMDAARIDALRKRLAQAKKDKAPDAIFVVGYGADISELDELYDLRVYFDFTMQPMLWQMWDGKLVPFGQSEADKNFYWKKYYYCDFYLLYRHKKFAMQQMDYYVDAVQADNLKMVPREPYDVMIAELVKQPIKQVKIMQPGPWGAYRYHDLWEVPGLECNAWNELAGIELSILIDVGLPDTINIPAQNIMIPHPVQMVGEYVNSQYPDLMPLQVWLDDGWFPEPVPFERSSMPIHDHPSTDYVRKHFNEPLGRYETYYIVEAYPNATTWMGYKDDADLEAWERKCREVEPKRGPIPEWQDYVRRWDTNVGDLFLIPPGTTHGHGGNQMILEMDTGPSVCGTEYSFFTFDFGRNTWDDKSKTMTAPPMRLHVDHSFDNQKWRRESYVKQHLRARPIVQDWNSDFTYDQYTSIDEMPFHIERLIFTRRAEYDTKGKYFMIATLAESEGSTITIRSKTNPHYQTKIEYLQSCLIPAGLGEFECVNEGQGKCTLVIIRLKKG